MINLTEWTPDGRAIFFGKFGEGNEKSSLWMVSSTGGTPRKVEGLEATADFRLHPDGRQAAYSTGQDAEEIWTLENFLPAGTPGRQSSSR